jgi:hypothetical protein
MLSRVYDIKWYSDPQPLVLSLVLFLDSFEEVDYYNLISCKEFWFGTKRPHSS